MKTISILNLKGGVAKTFTAANMAYELYRRGYKVLLIDNDKQGNLSKAYSRYDAENVAPVTRLLAGDWENADELIQHTEYFLTGKGLNAYAVAGIMGNLYAESGLMPNNLQNAYNNKLGKTDAEYTAAVDNGSYGNFVKDSAGYGLAQWTYWSRKQALLNHAKQAGVSIADLNMQLGFLWEELQGYAAVMDALKKAGSVRAASDAVLTGYEKPADQSETVKKKRAEYGEGYYKKYAAGNGTKYYRVRKSWTDAASQLGAFTSLENAKSACKAGYTVYDDNGKAVYTAVGQQTSAGVPLSVQVDILDLNIRTGAGTNYAKTGETTGKGVFTIVEVKAGQGASAGWGRLKSGAGWISLDYATRLA